MTVPSVNAIDAGPSHGSISCEWKRKNARPSASMSSWFSHASGIIISTAWWIGRPARCSSSSTSSKLAVSDAPAVQIGKARSRLGRCGLDAIASRARIQFRLPWTVLISPLWATIPVRVGERPRRERVGGEPAVHQRAARDSTRSSVEVGEELAELRRGEHALVDERAADSDGKYVAISPRELVLDALAHDEGEPVEVDAGCPPGVATNSCPKLGITARRRRAEARRVGGHARASRGR